MLLISLITVVFYLIAGRAITFSTAANQERVEHYLRNNGLPHIELSRLEGTWQVYDPGFIATNVSIKPDGEQGLEIDRIQLRLDSLQSLIQGAPAIREVELDGLRFAVIRDDKGLWVQGFPRGDSRFNLERVSHLISDIDRVSIAGVEIDVDLSEESLRLVSRKNEPLQVLRDGDRRLIDLPLYIERDIDPDSDTERAPQAQSPLAASKQSDGARHDNGLTLRGQYTGSPLQSGFASQLYLEAVDVDVAGFVGDLIPGDWRPQEAGLDARGWLTIDNFDIDFTGDIQVQRIVLARDAGREALLDSVAMQVRLKGRPSDKLAAVIPEIRFVAPDLDFSLRDIELALDSNQGDTTWGLRIRELGVDELVRLGDFLARRSFVDQNLVATLESISPRGRLGRVAVIWGDGKPRLTASVLDYSMSAYLGIPAIDRLDGFLSLERDKGYLDIDNEAFQLSFLKMFPESWPFTSGRGRVAYQLADDKVIVSSGLIELVNNELSAYGKLNLNLPPDKMRHTWGLTLGIKNANLLDAGRYIPTTLPENVSDWLTSAIQGGESTESGLSFHGALFREAPGVRKAYDLYFKADDTMLEYHPDWPRIEQLEGTVHVSSYVIRSDGVTGRVLDSAITTASVEVPVRGVSSVDTVLVKALAEGPFQDGIRVLRDTPLAVTTSNMAAAWQGSGTMQAILALDVPLGDRGEEAVRSSVEATFSDAELSMPEFDLSIAGLTGSIFYDDDQGLRSPVFTGTMFDRSVTGHISSRVLDDTGEITVQVDGSIAADSLYRWSDQLLLSRAQGSLEYQAMVHVPYGGEKDEVHIEATSDLKGVTINLPYPLAKQDAGEAMPVSYHQFMRDDGFIVNIDAGDSIKASLKIEDGIATGGRIHFGTDDMGAITYDGIRMSGGLDVLDFGAWMLATEELGELSDVSIEAEIAEHVDNATLDIRQLQLFDFELDDVRTIVTRGDGAWQARLDNQMLAGDVTVPDDDSVLMKIRLERLNFEGDESGEDPLGLVNPLEIEDVDFATDQLTIDGDDYGAWRFIYRVEEGRAKLSELAAETAGVRMLSDSGLEWRVTDGVHSSHYTGSILIDDLAAALRQFGYASSVEGEDMRLSADLDWGGSPAMLDIETVHGQVKIHKGKGRFVQAETGGALKLLGIFDFASIARRFRLDFSDVLDQGLEFDDIEGIAAFNGGEINVKERIVIEGSGGKFTVGGSVDLNTQALDNDMIVTLPVSRTLPWYAAYSAIATGPLAGAGVYIAQKVFENQIDQMSSAKYKISGTIDEPVIEFVTIFNDEVRESDPQ
ncbi:MAG: DUF3971 domain-containing protein [Proteobacteria bacterium]|nr:DUF3971 domain-containing protein [Pseudomonadota bacterium]